MEIPLILLRKLQLNSRKPSRKSSSRELALWLTTMMVFSTLTSVCSKTKSSVSTTGALCNILEKTREKRHGFRRPCRFSFPRPMCQWEKQVTSTQWASQCPWGLSTPQIERSIAHNLIIQHYSASVPRLGGKPWNSIHTVGSSITHMLHLTQKIKLRSDI